MKVGILALQGAVARQVRAFEALGARAVEVRDAPALRDVDAVVLPGGESTTISRLLVVGGLLAPLRSALRAGMPAFGTCAGMILLASEVIDGRDDQRTLGAIDLSVRRNAFGRQVDSFEADLEIAGLDSPAFPGVFIRAPVVEHVGAEVEVLAALDGRAVLCRQAGVLVASFHPELVDDLRLHDLFLSRVARGASTGAGWNPA